MCVDKQMYATFEMSKIVIGSQPIMTAQRLTFQIGGSSENLNNVEGYTNISKHFDCLNVTNKRQLGQPWKSKRAKRHLFTKVKVPQSNSLIRNN